MVHLEDNSEWFATWFDSPYYHLLYQNRDDNEARLFIGRLIEFLNLPKDKHLLDLACGAGRHSRVLNALGYRVTGVDLSANSIREATEKAEPGMDFFVHDMRNELPRTFDAVFNLFTSFGYFDSLSDNLKVLKSVYAALPSDGVLVIDFLNSEKVVKNLVRHHIIERGEITFNIEKIVEDGRILKSINFIAEGKQFHFQEKVQALTQNDFNQLIAAAGFVIAASFGDYQLNEFDLENSDRLILICKKP